MKTLRSTLTLAPQGVTALPKTADPFYLTSAWRSLVARLIKLRGRQCQKCGRTGCRLYGDHVVELKDGGAMLDEANIELLCGSCHGRKTAAAAKARAR